MADDPHNVPHKTQISLRAIFLSVTYFAIASLLALRLGTPFFMVAIGVFATWLSYRGYLWWLQTRQNRPRVFIVAWMLFGASLALPAMTLEGCSGPPKSTRGWQLVYMGAMHGVEMIGDISRDLVTVDSDERSGLDPPLGASTVLLNLIHTFLHNFPNVMMLLSPVLLYWQQRADRGHWSTAWGCAAVVTWMWATAAGSDLLIGYYFWSAAISLSFLTRPIQTRTLIAMGILGALSIAMHLVNQQ